ncbi:putative ribonuclease H-like domain-containing protein [Tanacetum coccineum]|uniref:Ribonuclease H-like domain-containing protein n=1 Tax=Tanacetum coccineum TaxID=301880 RepID=A0ABQ5H1W5_9ASTR
MLENGLWFIRNHPLILRKWNPDVDLLKEDVVNVLVWVKLHGVLVTAFNEDGLSAIATKLGTPLMLDFYTSDMCLQSWGRSSYARVMIELRTDMELKDNIMVALPKIMGEGRNVPRISDWVWRRNLKNPSQISRVVPVGPKLGFKPYKEYTPVPKKPTASPSGNKKKCVAHTNEANSSGSSFMNVKNSSTSNTPIIDKIRKFQDLLIDGQAILVDEAGVPLKKVECPSDYDSEDEVASVDNDMARSLASKNTCNTPIIDKIETFKDLLIDGQAILVDEAGNLLKKVECSGDYDSKDEVASVDNDMAHPYDDDMYEGHDLPQAIQVICDNLDIRVRGDLIMADTRKERHLGTYNKFRNKEKKKHFWSTTIPLDELDVEFFQEGENDGGHK